MPKLLKLSHPFILGSSSPRRQDMIKGLGLDFKVVSPQIIEQQRDGETPSEYVLRNCRDKAGWVAENQSLFPRAVILCADTIVCLGDRVLEKPGSPSEAKEMLRSLSGNQHEVLSAFCLLDTDDVSNPIAHRLVKTKVYFRSLREQEIDFYIATGEPHDKAGAYGIQGIGSFLVDKIDGSYSNVVGLPLAELISALFDVADS